MFWAFYCLSKYVYYHFNKGPLQASKISGKSCDAKIMKNLPVLFKLIYHEKFSYVITLTI